MNKVVHGASENLLERIVRLRDDLRKSDKRVADVVLDRPSEVVDMTLAKLASAAEVSEPTVVRFCVAIGCEGYRDMRVRLASSLAFARTTSHTAISPEDDFPTIVTKVFDYNLSNLTWAQSHLDTDAFSQAVTVLSEAHRIEFFGFGASGIVARDAQQKFPLFGVACGAPSDSHQMYMTAKMLEPGDVAVAISNTGHTREILSSMKVAKEAGAVTIGITGAKESPLVHVCDVSLVVETLENTNVYTPTVSRLSHLIVMDILSTAVSVTKGEDHQTRLADMKDRLAKERMR